MRSQVVTQPLTLTVTDLSHEGQGVARLDGRVVFIDGALPGETVEVQLLRRHKGIQEARLLQVVEASPHRVEPLCQHYRMCGGCIEQHLDPAQQLVIKQGQLLENLARIGHATPESVLPALQADIWNYRRRARLGARWVPQKNRTLVGFRERSNSKLADLQRCVVLAEPLASLVEPLSVLLGQLSVRDRVPQVEAAVAEHATALVIRILNDLTEEDIALLREFETTHGVHILLQREGYDSIKPLTLERVQPLTYSLPDFDVTFEFLPNDFIQVNAALNRSMIARTLELLQLQATDRVLDLFCGLGNFTLPLARRVAEVVGVEGEASLVERARQNAARNGIDNARFVVANLFEDQVNAPWTKQRFDKVLLDPPRAGAREILPVVARSGASRVAYVSCHPGSLARDAGILVNEFGFKLEAAGVMDMFPHTAHVESMAIFTR